MHTTMQRRPSKAVVEQGVQTPQIDQVVNASAADADAAAADAAVDKSLAKDGSARNSLVRSNLVSTGSKKVVKIKTSSLDARAQLSSS